MDYLYYGCFNCFFVLDYRLFIKSGDEINPKTIDKRNKKMIFFCIIFSLFCMGLTPKLGTFIFFDINENYEKSNLYSGKILGFKTLGNGKRSGGTWAALDVYASDKNEKNSYLMVCNLLVLEECDYGQYKGEEVYVKGLIGSSYPLKHKIIIYEINTKDGKLNIKSDQQIKIYKENKLYLLFFICLVLLPSFIISLMISNKILKAGSK